MRPPACAALATALEIAMDTAAATATALIGHISPPMSAPPRTLTAPLVAALGAVLGFRRAVLFELKDASPSEKPHRTARGTARDARTDRGMVHIPI